MEEEDGEEGKCSSIKPRDDDGRDGPASCEREIVVVKHRVAPRGARILPRRDMMVSCTMSTRRAEGLAREDFGATSGFT